MTLEWLRITLKGQDDFKYIGKKMQEGWKFVDVKEVPEIEQTSVVKMEEDTLELSVETLR